MFTQSVPGTTVTQTFTQTGNERRKVSADVFTFNGVVPLDIRQRPSGPASGFTAAPADGVSRKRDKG